MAPSRRKGSSKASSVAAAAAAKKKVWKVGDLVLAKVKGFPAWPATVSEPEKWGYSTDWKKVLVYFFGTKQIAFCNPGDVEAFTEEKKKSLLSKRHGKGADFVRALQEIVDSYEKAKAQELDDDVNSGDEYTVSNAETLVESKVEMGNGIHIRSLMTLPDSRMENLCVSTSNNESHHLVDVAEMENGRPDDMDTMSKEQVESASSFDHLREPRLVASGSSRKRLTDAPLGSCAVQKRTAVRRSRSTVKVEPCKLRSQRMPLKDNSTVVRDVSSNGIRNESAKRSKRIRKSPGNSVWYHMDSPGCSAAFASNISAEENGSEIGATNSDSVSFSGGNTLDSSCKSEHNGIVVECLDQGVHLSDRCHFPAETYVLKKKRKPNRKRANHSTVALTGSPNISSALDIQVEGAVSHSPNACEYLLDPLPKANGDEHLPLVKRARVRMGKPLLEEKQLNESSKEDSITNEKPPLLSLISGNSFHNANGSLATQETKEPVWNANTYQLRASVDGEAALPPSKRLHRALKAMSANAAEEDQTFIDAQGATKVSISGCCDSSDKSSSHTSVDNEVGSASEVQHANSSGDNDSNANDVSETPPGLTSPTSEVLAKASPEPKSCGHLIELSKSYKASPEPKSCDHLTEVSKSYNSGCCLVTKQTFQNSVEDTHVDSPSLIVHSDVTKITIKSPHPSSVFEQKQCVPGSGLLPRDPSSPLLRTVNIEVLESNRGTFEDIQEEKLVQDQGTSQLDHQGQDSSEVDEDRSSQDLDGAQLSVVNVDFGENKQSLMSPSDKNVQTTCEVVKEVQNKSDDKDTDLDSMKVLIAAAQAKRELSVSNSLSDTVLDDKAVCDSVSSPSSVRKMGALDQVSSPSPILIHPPIAGSRSQLTHIGTVDVSRGKKSIRVGEMEDPTTSSSYQRQKSFGKWANMEANSARKSFECMLGTLSRTKESIGRATRLAIDCAKHGIAAEVLEILVRNLETGSSLHKRVDLFFLVDSITQCSRGQKGDIGDIYPSLVQRMLPRLLSAAAPPGHAARENRKQCLKVLRLWLERKTLPESIIRHHMRELESAEASYTMVHCRRPLRMERALNDPIREMEGMHVDEYGSNASFQLPGLCMPPMLEDEDGSDAEERSFEAVTPEQDPEMPVEREVTPSSTFEKHCHILEDVDGELEMEDVAPSYDMVKSSATDVPAVNNIDSLHNRFEHHPLSYAPPLPEDCPPPPPPLPASPPPMVPPPPVLSEPVRCHSFTGIVDLKFHPHSMQSTSQQHISQQLDTPILSSVRSDTEHYYAHGCRDTGKQSMRPGSFSSTSVTCKTPAYRPPVHMGNNIQHMDHGPVHSKSYQLQPPPPTLSNQFSYVPDDHRRLSWMEASSSSFTNRYGYGFDTHREDMYENRERMEFTPHEMRERGKIDGPVHSVPVQLRNPEAAYTRISQCGPPEESTRMLDRGWSFPPRTLNYHNPRPFRPPEAPRFWRPR